MTNQTNKTLLRDSKRWRIKQIDELDDSEFDEQKCPQKIGILPGPTKKWQIERIDELDNDELDEFYCSWKLPFLHKLCVEKAIVWNILLSFLQHKSKRQ